ncbi:MBL fold metallo-hydrolase [Halorussus salilacus]|uniref:MBL fold metallo-hydrolase n=1 Tax=Halorussus salilacus TaxID=2953750 RepID=UPI00209E2439|nr:MBL fold metallo-hydrolase [Halorussus salilacus]USZ67252.1 MBL fold metallo-hydrolase [Halorussus salilacus]
MTTTRLREEARADLWWVDLGSVNCYLVEDGDDLVLVDAGTPRSADDIARAIREAGHAVDDVARILVTHYDADHVGALGKLGVDAPVYLGREDAVVLAGQQTPDWRNHKGLLQRLVQPLVVAPGVPIRPVDDGDEVGGFTVYRAPGHSPGHVVYLGGDVAFLGDLVREKDGRLEPSPWHLSHDTDEVRRSIRALADRVPDFEVAAMGHGTPIVANGGDRFRELAARL